MRKWRSTVWLRMTELIPYHAEVVVDLVQSNGRDHAVRKVTPCHVPLQFGGNIVGHPVAFGEGW